MYTEFKCLNVQVGWGIFAVQLQNWGGDSLAYGGIRITVEMGGNQNISCFYKER